MRSGSTTNSEKFSTHAALKYNSKQNNLIKCIDSDSAMHTHRDGDYTTLQMSSHRLAHCENTTNKNYQTLYSKSLLQNGTATMINQNKASNLAE